MPDPDGGDGMAATLGVATDVAQEALTAEAQAQATPPPLMGTVAADAAVAVEETTPTSTSTPVLQPPSTTTANSAAPEVCNFV
jgi:hypothetical protein